MRAHAISFWRDDGGFVVSAELVLVLTVGVLAMLAGLHAMASAVNGELNDLSNAWGAIDQSYTFRGFSHGGFRGFGLHSFVAGSGYVDSADFCDCAAIWSGGGASKVSGGTWEAGGTGHASAVDSQSGPVIPADPCPVCPPDVHCDGCGGLGRHSSGSPGPTPTPALPSPGPRS